jgi:DNA polymerase I-like protein with 3'-5' exonuclease and polymerase domains
LPYLQKLSPSSDLVVDFETTGLDVLEPGFRPVGLGIACSMYPDGIYCPIDPGLESYQVLLYLCNFNLIAHNVSYDARVLEQYLRANYPNYKPMSLFPWKNDTYLMFKALSTEGYAGQSWSLKAAQMSVLGWASTNEEELDRWLAENGKLKKNIPPELLRKLKRMDGCTSAWNWEALTREEQAQVYKCVDKGRMCEAPNKILGYYAGLDAQSTWALYEHFQSYYDQFPDMKDILENEMMVLAELEIEEFFHGMYVDEELLEERIAGVQSAMAELLEEFHENSDATGWISSFNEQRVDLIVAARPPEFTKTGKVAARYTKWKEKVAIAKATNHFNPNSKDQLAWLFYDCLFKTSEVTPHWNWRGDKSYKFTVTIDGEEHEVDGTATGKRKVDKKILPKLGKAGKLLTRYNELNKLLGYMTKMQDSLAGGFHHTQLRLAGTLTFRCSGTGGVNIQQLPKARDYLDCLKPRPGHVFIQMDVDALEPVVLAELSEDEAMMNLYGPGAKPNDIYLYVGASIPALRDEVCAYGYDPLNPTAEAIALTKKKAKRIRGICKVVHLSAGYGAGAGKIYATLIQAGVVITLDEVKEIHKAYWELFGGVVEYQKKLKAEWSSNGGWFINGRGMPVSVAEHLEKDILNRCIQNTGHMNMLTYLKHLQTLRKANTHLSIQPIVCDFHDECIFEVPTEQADEVLELFRTTWSLTNTELGGIIPLSGEPEVCYSFSEFKCEGGYKVDDITKEFDLAC